MSSSNEGIPPRFQPMFPYPFNRMQMECKDDVLNSDKDVVICSPTGSGKTVVLEMAVVRTMEILQHKQRPSVVYLGPLKSLCQERFDDWKLKSEKVGFVVDQLTGDSDDLNNELQVLNSCDLLCSTPEKFDWLLRRYRHLFEHVRCVLIDEVHTVADDTRGSTLEALITRLKFHKSDKGIPPPRFVAVSATIPNVKDLGQWVGADHAVRHFDDSYRAVRLEKVVIPCAGPQNAFAFDNSLNRELPGVIRKYSEGKPSLVFCMTRKSCESSARACCDGITSSNAKDSEVLAEIKKLQEKSLKDLILKGTAFHHAGLCPVDRHIVENLFIKGKIVALCSTSTLAIGVNLPAHLVVIKGTQSCSGPQGAPQEMADTTFLQMTGRAGRPKFDTSGIAVVLTQFHTENRYRDLLQSGQLIESTLHKRIGEQINAELNLKSISSLSTAVDWVKSTFMYVRLKQNPYNYMKNGVSHAQGVDRWLEGTVQRAVDEMVQYDLLEIKPGQHPELISTGYGRLMARNCMTLETMKLIMAKSAQKNTDLPGLFDCVTKCSDFENSMLRRDETEDLVELNTLIKFPVKGVSSKEDKISILLQSAIGCVQQENQFYETESKRILRVAYRVASCFIDTVNLRGGASFNMLLNATLFYRAMRTEIWYDSPYVSKQLRGIGPVLSRRLANAGYDTWEKLATAKPRLLEEACERLPPFGMKIVQEAQSVPKYAVEIQQLDNDEPGTGRILVKVKLVNGVDIGKHSVRGTLMHKLVVLVGKPKLNLLFGAAWRLDDKRLVAAAPSFEMQKEFVVTKSPITVKLLSLELNGVDVSIDDFKVKIKRAAPGTKTKASTGLKVRNNSPVASNVSLNPEIAADWLVNDSEPEDFEEDLQDNEPLTKALCFDEISMQPQIASQITF